MTVSELTTSLRARADHRVGQRMARSAQCLDGDCISTVDVPDWLERRTRVANATVRRIPIADLDGWSFSPETGNLRHRSGRFFTVEGLRVERPGVSWEQPIIVQPEIGILGILATEFDGVLHFLMQAKMEPGNPNLVQLSPTVQATRSNYSQAHGGARVRYLEHFLDRDPSRVLADVLQSEHGSWFYRKRNRNMIVEVDPDVPVYDDFCWLTLGQIGALLHLDNVVNMDARTVLASAPIERDERTALDSDSALLSWFTEERARQEVRTELIPLRDVSGWALDDDSIARHDGRFFRVVGMGVDTAGREVTSWTQPLFEPSGRGLVAFACRRFDGVPHLLVEARVEGGFLDTAEIGATVQCVPSNYAHLSSGERPLFLDLLASPSESRVLYATVHSEEGGRFLNAESRYVVVETDESSTPSVPPAGFRWATSGQLNWLAGHSRYVDVQARSLLAVLNSGALDLR